MHNFLNTTFKFLSRSLIITAVSLFGFQNTYAVPSLELRSSAATVATGENWNISGSANDVAGCKVDGSFDFTLTGGTGAGWYPKNFNTAFIDDATVGSYTYTATCFSEIEFDSPAIGGIGDETYTVSQPLPRFVQDGLGGLIITGSGQQVTKSVTVTVTDVSGDICTTHPGSNACELCSTNPESDQCKRCSVQTVAGDSENGICSCADNPGQAQCSATGEEVDEVTGKVDPEECGVFGSWTQCAIDAGLGIIDYAILPLFTGLLRLSSMLFEITIYFGVVKFSDLVGIGSDSWVVSIWGTVRDILNIGLIFVLLYAAIQVIVGRGKEIKKLIAGVILFGVLTNFSLFLTRAAIDFSNIVALEFYNQMRGPDTTIDQVAFNSGLGATVVQTTGLIAFYAPPDSQNSGVGGIAVDKVKALKDSFLYRFSMILIFIAVAFIFFQAAFIFLARTMVLIFLMILSPFMFAGGIFAPLESWVAKWRQEFIGQTILAPMFFILLYIALTILGSLTEALNDQLKNIGDAENDTLLSIGIIAITTGLTIFAFSLALNQAKEWAGSIGGKAAALGGKIGSGLITAGFNQTVGRATGAALGGASALLAKAGQNTLGRTALFKNSSFDIRNIKAVQDVGKNVNSGVSKALSAATGGAISGVQINAGTGLKNRETRLKEIQTAADAKIENEFKRIDGEVKKYQVTDKKITDVNGNVITRGPTEDDDAWGKRVKQINVDHKKAAEAKKQDYLARMSTSSRARTEAGKAAFRAKKAAEEKLDKSQKAARDNEKHKADLKLYTKTLVDKLASDAGARLDPPLNTVVLTKTKDEIEKMSSGEIVEQWKSVQDQIEIIQETFLAQNKTVLKDPTHPDFGTKLQQKKAIAGQLKYASGARNEIPSLTKKIEDFDKR